MLVKTAIRPCELGVWLTRNICLYWQNNLKQQTKAVKEPPRRFPLSHLKASTCEILCAGSGTLHCSLKAPSLQLATAPHGSFRGPLSHSGRSYWEQIDPGSPTDVPTQDRLRFTPIDTFWFFFFLVLMWFSSIIWLVPIPLDVYRRDSNSFKAFPGRNRVVELKVAAEF